MGEKKLSFEDVQVGDEAPVITHTLTRTDLVRYAGASGDFNPMHHDEVAAQAAGQPSVFGHGMFSMGLLGTALTDFVGVGNITRYKVRFAAPDVARRGALLQDRRDRQARGGRPEAGGPHRDALQRGRRGQAGGRGHGRPAVVGGPGPADRTPHGFRPLRSSTTAQFCALPAHCGRQG